METNDQERIALFRGLDLKEESGADRTWVLVALLTLGALLLRLFRIGEWSFWEDEVFTLREVNHSLGELFSLRMNRYPLFPILQRAFLPLVPGVGEGSFRLLPALIGTLNIPALYFAGRTLVGRGPALLAAAFLALSPWHIYWSQNCRYYTLVSLLAILTAGLFWWGLRRRQGSLAPLAALFPALLATLSHPSAAFVVAALGGYMVRDFLVKKGPAGRRARSQALRFLVVVALLGLLAWGLMRESLASYYAAKAPNPILHLPMTLAFFMGVPLLTLAALAWFPLRARASDTADLLFLLLVVPMATVALLGFRVRASAQYLFYTLPFFCLLGAWGAMAWARMACSEGRRGGKVLALLPAAMVLLPMAAQTVLYFGFEEGWRPPWREAARFIERERGDGDRIAVANSRPLDWYLNPILLNFRKKAPSDVIHLEHWNLSEELERLIRGAEINRAWVVVNPPLFREKDPDGEALRRIMRTFRLAAHFPAWCGPKDLSLFIYVRDGSFCDDSAPAESGGL